MGPVSSEHLPTIVTAEQGKNAEGPKLEDEALDDDDAPPSDVRRATSVTDEELRAFLVLLFRARALRRPRTRRGEAGERGAFPRRSPCRG
jgi:hypothetical protein